MTKYISRITILFLLASSYLFANVTTIAKSNTKISIDATDCRDLKDRTANANKKIDNEINYIKRKMNENSQEVNTHIANVLLDTTLMVMAGSATTNLEHKAPTSIAAAGFVYSGVTLNKMNIEEVKKLRKKVIAKYENLKVENQRILLFNCDSSSNNRNNQARGVFLHSKKLRF
jgi:hypothetical protein